MAQMKTPNVLCRLEDGNNFNNWKFRLELLMEEKGLGNILTCEKVVKEDDKKKDAEARSLIVQCISDNFLEIVKGCKSA